MASEKLLPGTIKPKRTNSLVIALLLLSPLALIDVSYAAGRVFYDDFESQTATDTKWMTDVYGTPRPRCQNVSDSIDHVAGPYVGTKMLQCKHTSGDGAATAFETLRLNTAALYTNELFVRTRMRPDTDMDRSDISPKKILRFYVVGGHDMFTSFFDNSDRTGTKVEAIPNGSGGVHVYWASDTKDFTGRPATAAPSTPSSLWHKVEYYIRQDTGVLKVWHDGVLVLSRNGLNFQGNKWGDFYVGSNWTSAHDGNNHFYLDEFEIYSDMGSGATGTMSDATISQGGSSGITPPATPLNLRVQ